MTNNKNKLKNDQQQNQGEPPEFIKWLQWIFHADTWKNQPILASIATLIIFGVGVSAVVAFMTLLKPTPIDQRVAKFEPVTHDWFFRHGYNQEIAPYEVEYSGGEIGELAVVLETNARDTPDPYKAVHCNVDIELSHAGETATENLGVASKLGKHKIPKKFVIQPDTTIKISGFVSLDGQGDVAELLVDLRPKHSSSQNDR